MAQNLTTRKNPQRSKASESSYSLMEFMRDFPDDETCLVWLWKTRYALNDANEAHCPKCEEIRTFKRYTTAQQRQSWTCPVGHHIHPTAGTIFHKSSTSLQLWFFAMYLMTSTRCGISAKQLERELGVTYKTAWRMFTLIRNVLMDDGEVALNGTVEMDETFMGGKPRLADKRAFAATAAATPGMSIKQAARKWSNETKIPGFGMAERNRVEWIDGTPKPTVTQYGKVVARVVPSIQAATLNEHMVRHVEVDTRIYTDEVPAYRGLTKDGWKHKTVRHKESVYVDGDVHTQQIDGFWSLVKRGIDGTHFHVSAKWLQGYLNEYAWRYYRRRKDGQGNPRPMFLEMALRSALPIR
jgi:transposase-like protein